MLQQVLGCGNRLNAWEQEFVVSVSDRYYMYGNELTAGQFLCLEKIYHRLFPVK